MKINFLLWIQLVPSLAIMFHEGCEVKSELEIDYERMPLLVGAWIPYEENSKILSIEVEVGQNVLSAHDNIDIFSHEIKFTRKREGQPPIVNNVEISPFKLGHWATFVFRLDGHYNLVLRPNAYKKWRRKLEKMTHKSILDLKNYYSKLLDEVNAELLLFRKEVTATPTKFRITGDYFTIFCSEGIREWNVNEDPVVIPLDDQESHTFEFYSNEHFEASLILDERVFPLGWHDGALTMIPSLSDPLPPFQLHLVELHCHGNGKVTCDIKTGKNRVLSEKDIQISSIPTSLSIRSETGEFFVLEYVSLEPNTMLLDVPSVQLGVEECLDVPPVPPGVEECESVIGQKQIGLLGDVKWVLRGLSAFCIVVGVTMSVKLFAKKVQTTSKLHQS